MSILEKNTMQRIKPLYIPYEEHCRYYGPLGDRQPRFDKERNSIDFDEYDEDDY